MYTQIHGKYTRDPARISPDAVDQLHLSTNEPIAAGVDVLDVRVAGVDNTEDAGDNLFLAVSVDLEVVDYRHGISVLDDTRGTKADNRSTARQKMFWGDPVLLSLHFMQFFLLLETSIHSTPSYSGIQECRYCITCHGRNEKGGDADHMYVQAIPRTEESKK